MKRSDWVVLPLYRATLHLSAEDYMEGRCMRCDRRSRLVTPEHIDIVLAWMKAFRRAHQHCPQTLLGARWELIAALYGRKYDLEHGRGACGQ